MRFAVAASALAFAAAAMAQNNPIVHVGSKNGSTALAFDPPTLNVTQPNTTITFIFDGNPGNHTVAQSSFAKPCEPLDGGFNSGFFFVNGSNGPFGVWSLTVQDVSTPLWFYCAQQVPKVHCTAGMVGAINAPATGNTFDKFVSQAASAATVVFPSTALTGVGAFATASIATTSLPASSAGQTGGANATSSGGGASGTSPSSAGNVKASGLVAFLAAVFGVAIL